MLNATPDYEQQLTNRFSAPVDRELVHRRAISEVFLTGIQSTSNTSYTVSAQWPRWHVFYGSLSHRYDSALVVETLRQLTILIAHTRLGVPLGMQFLMPKMSISVDHLAVNDPSCPAEVTATVTVTAIKESRHGIVEFCATAIFLVNGREIATGKASARIVDPDVYLRFRLNRNSPGMRRVVTPLPAAKVGHSSDWNVVLGQGESPDCWPLHVNPSNPVLFDHPLDHVPGVLLIEAVRQSLRISLDNPSADITILDALFVSIVELEDETEVILESLVTREESVEALVSIRTHGEIMMSAAAEVTLHSQPAVSDLTFP